VQLIHKACQIPSTFTNQCHCLHLHRQCLHLPHTNFIIPILFTAIPQHRLVSNYQLNAQFLYSITIYMLQYNPRHVSSSTMVIFRRTNCIITASSIITLCKRLYNMLVESGLQSVLNRHTVWPFTESDDTRCCSDTICPPEDEHSTARNMSRIIT